MTTQYEYGYKDGFEAAKDEPIGDRERNSAEGKLVRLQLAATLKIVIRLLPLAEDGLRGQLEGSDDGAKELLAACEAARDGDTLRAEMLILDAARVSFADVILGRKPGGAS